MQNRLSSATKWLSSTAIRLFSSSSSAVSEAASDLMDEEVNEMSPKASSRRVSKRRAVLPRRRTGRHSETNVASMIDEIDVKGNVTAQTEMIDIEGDATVYTDSTISKDAIVSTDATASTEEVVSATIVPTVKRGRPRADPNAPRRPNRVVKRKHELPSGWPPLTLSRTRSSTISRGDELEEMGPADGQTRYLLTLQALPPGLRVLAQILHPPTRNHFEEHRLVCRLLHDEEATPHREIFIPTFRRLPRNRTVREAERGVALEQISDEQCLQRHRPLELAERRERRREDELLRYELYIRKLSREYPELLNRKYSFSSSAGTKSASGSSIGAGLSSKLSLSSSFA